MPIATCPHCSRQIPYEAHEARETFVCAGCDGKFTLAGGIPLPPVRHQSQADPLDVPEEPWFYGFLEGYARLAMWLGIIVAALGVLLYAGVSLLAAVAANAPLLAIAILVFAVVFFGVLVLGVLFWVSLVFLAVDAGRTLREIRELLRNRPS